MTTRTRADDEGLIRNPKDWPLWPFLPLKRCKPGDRPHELPELGTLIDSPRTPITTVHLCSLYDFADREYADIPNHHYESVGEMLADGWKVD